MTVERETTPKRPFGDTPTAYRLGFEAAFKSAQADNVPGGLVAQLSAEESRLMNPDATNDTSVNKPISIKVGRSMAPVALPIDYSPKKGELTAHNMTQIYLFGRGDTLESIGNYYSVSRERVRQQVFTGVTDSLKELPASTEYRLDELTMAKPVVSVVEKIKGAMGAGVTRYADLRAEGFGINDLARARKVTAVPYAEIHGRYSEYLAILNDPSYELAVACEVIKEITLPTYREYSKKTENHPKILTDLYALVRAGGLRPRFNKGDMEFLAEFLEKNGLPVGSVNASSMTEKYRFTLFRLGGEIAEMFREAKGERFDKMRKLPVVNFGPPLSESEEVPTSRELKKGRRGDGSQFVRVFSLLEGNRAESIGDLRRLRIGTGDLVGDAPPVRVWGVPVGNLYGLYVELKNAQELALHLARELEKRKMSRAAERS